MIKDIDLPSSGGIRDAKKKKKEYVTESQEDQTEDREEGQLKFNVNHGLFNIEALSKKPIIHCTYLLIVARNEDD
jgi:hypothetical protein